MLQLRFVPQRGETGRSMIIRMVQQTAGRRLQLGYVGLDDRDRALVYMPAQNVLDYTVCVEVLDLRPELTPDRLILCLGAYGNQVKKFVFAGARLDGTPIPLDEQKLRGLFLGDPEALFPSEFLIN